MRTFTVVRQAVPKVVVAEGVEFTNGQCALQGLAGLQGVAVYPSITELTSVLGNGVVVYNEPGYGAGV